MSEKFKHILGRWLVALLCNTVAIQEGKGATLQYNTYIRIDQRTVLGTQCNAMQYTSLTIDS
jgi:hypothetical protein